MFDVGNPGKKITRSDFSTFRSLLIKSKVLRVLETNLTEQQFINLSGNGRSVGLARISLKNVWNKLWPDLEGQKEYNVDHREEITDFVQSIPGFQECDEEDKETWMTCDAEDSGFQMLNDDEIVTFPYKKNPNLLKMKRMKTRTTTAMKVARVYQMLTRFLR
ncbi:uncharacterized protein TNCV_3141621 [Trichonephila clavipes]|nr:uncharacterized protein TNCV_3141621 [Trichonephila clavipes]